MAKGKSAAVADESRGRGSSEERGKRPIWHTREAMDIDPKPTTIRSPKNIFKYLSKNDVEL